VAAGGGRAIEAYLGPCGWVSVVIGDDVAHEDSEEALRGEHRPALAWRLATRYGFQDLILLDSGEACEFPAEEGTRSLVEPYQT
jgi:hypothetical protein